LLWVEAAVAAVAVYPTKVQAAVVLVVYYYLPHNH
jgi:hypothetical protein